MESGEKMAQMVKKKVKAVNLESFVITAVLVGSGVFFGSIMGFDNMFSTIMKTAHELLLDTVFYILAVAVLAGALGAVGVEFGLIALLNKILSPLMKPLFNLPGAAAIGGITTYISDNPAIISLAKDEGFKKYFKKHQLPVLCNLGTSFGMGLIVTSFMIARGKEFLVPAIVGNIGAIIGCIVSVRIMLSQTKKLYKEEDSTVDSDDSDLFDYREIREGTILQRFLESVLEGGRNGVEMGLAIIPGVLFICTLVLMLTFGPSPGGYTGAAFEGIELLPKIGGFLYPVLQPVFGFSSPQALAFPITALGAVGAAIGLVPGFLEQGWIKPSDIAVFTAMGMCWSGYLSTHVAMMDALGTRELINKAITAHTIGGLAAGISANLIMRLISLL
ncbi:hypothetical protein HYG86_09700 [Alkalicella caledoniensis]|uniref:Transporter gate domain protein n=1 Tax=Alkalicella caledoniensis TaxID=2731377 RepID=A0A7G9W8L0_ALKCA|nr:hypothetical protein [Alkalicella caledoniensis]QNO15022.1 hypothetical protein HYG86_09700 [Alkalicella caledoniensis]